MLRRMVERAVEEHRSALEHGEIRPHSFRYLRNLAWEMTMAGSTALSDKEARLAISNTVHELKESAKKSGVRCWRPSGSLGAEPLAESSV
jgi:hypothetical protein